MAKKKSFELDDDFGFGSGELDMPDFDFEPGKIKEDRSPVTKAIKIAGSVGDGILDQAKSPAFIRKMIRDSLPKGYGSAMDLADETAGTLKNLYNDAAKEIKPVVKDLKRVTKRMMPQAEAVLPQKLAAKVKAWANSDSDNSSGSLNVEQLRDQALQAQLGEIFKYQTEQQLQEKAENEARDTLRDSIEHDRHRDMLGQLDAIRVNVQQVASYQNKVDAAYQRKSLELQFRHYFVAQDALNETKRFNAIAQTSLEAIQKNTGLPEFVKLKNSERLHEALRNRFIDGLNDSVFARRRQFMQKVGGSLMRSAKDKLSGFLDNVKDGLSMTDSVLDMHEMQQEMGMGPSGSELAGNAVGGMITDSFGRRVGKGIRKGINKVDKNGNVDRYGNILQYGVENAPQLAIDYARSDKHETGGFFDGLVRTFKDAILGANAADNSIIGDNAADMQAPQVFNRMGQKSLTEIIPGYLARIYRELQITRTGDESIQLTSFDFNSNKFVEKSKLAKNVFKSVISKDDRVSTRDQINQLIDEIDPDKKLSDEQRKALGMQLLRDNMNNSAGSAKRLSNWDAYTGEAGRYADTFSQMFEDYFKDDKDKSKQASFARKFSRLGDRISDSRKTIQDQVNVGNRDILEEYGIIDAQTGQINMRKLYEYFYSNDFDPENEAAPASGPRSTARAARAPRMAFRRRPQAQPVAIAAQPSNFTNPQPSNQEPLTNPFRQSTEELIKAINESSSKEGVQIVNETLLRIEKRLNEGFGGPGNGSSPQSAGSKRWWNMSVGEHGANLWDFGRKVSGKINKAVSWAGNEMFGGAKRAYGFGKFGLGRGLEAFKNARDKIADVYVGQEVIPRLQALKLKLGNAYYVMENGQKKFIKSIKEITGDVFDEEGKLVMSYEDAKKAWVRYGAGQKALQSLTKLKDWTLGAVTGGIKTLRSVIPPVYQMALDLAKKGFDLALDGPQDVYIHGNPNPVLLARTMRVGGYASRVTSREIRKVSDIDGPVVDHTGNVVLSAEDLAKGLLDKNGKPLKTGLAKLLGKGKELLDKGRKMASWAIDGVMSGARRLKEGIQGAFRGDLFNNMSILSGNSIGGGGGGSTKLLLQIRNLLNQRLPGEPTTFDDVELMRGPGLQGLKDRGAGLAGKVKKSAQAGWERTRALFGGFAKKDGLQISGMTQLTDVLTDLRKKLADEKKKAFGDSDGDGVRDGSYKDWLRKQKDKVAGAKDAVAEKASQYSSKGKSLLGAVGGGLKGLYDKFRGRKRRHDDDEEDDDDGIDVNVDMDGNRPRRRRGPKGKGFWGKAKGLGGGLLRGGGKLLGLAGTAYGAYSAYDNIKKGNYGEAALDGGLALGGAALTTGGLAGLTGLGSAIAGGAGALATGAGALMAGIGGIAAAPVLLGAAAIAAVGVAGYYGYKALTKKRLETLSKIRYAQYGFLANDEDHLQAVFGLEDDLVGSVVYDKEGKASFDHAKIDLDRLKKSMKAFDIDLANNAMTNQWLDWFANRFKPVFLTHMTALRKINPQASLAAVDGMKPEEKKAYLNLIKFPEGPYNVMTSPFPNLKSLSAGAGEVKTMIEAAEIELNKVAGGKKDVGGMNATQVAGAAALGSATSAANLEAGKKLAGIDVEVPRLSSSALSEVTKQTIDNGGMLDTRGIITAMGVSLSANQFATGKLDALTVIRYKTYGLKQMELEKVRALSQLESKISKNVTFGKGNTAMWEGSVEKIAQDMAPVFGVSAVNTNDGSAWLTWFNQRFLPTYMNYLTAIAVATNKTNVETAARALTPQQAVDVAMVVRTSNGKYSGSSVSVWQVPATPWPGYELGNEVGITDNNLQGLKDDAKRVVLDEAKSKTASVGADGKPTSGSGTAEAAAPTTFWGKTTKAASDLWQGAKNAVSGIFGGKSEISGGRNVADMGAGTGGDLAGVPMPKGNKSWAALKDTITAAGKAAGVDPRLMAAIAAIESGFDYTVKAASSSATGLFQFIDDTWKTMVQRYGSKYGIDANTKPTDPRANALMGAEFLKENAAAIKGAINRPVTDTDLYVAHFLGPAGAKKFLSADPKAIAANLFPAPARANPAIFYDNGRPRTIAEIYAMLNDKVRSRGKQFGIDAGSEDIVTKPTAAPTTTAAAPSVSAAPATSAPAASGTFGAQGPAASGTPNPLGIPVADQAPGVMPSANSVPATNPTAAPAAQKAPVQPDVAAFGAGYISNRARDTMAQQGFQRDVQAEIMGGMKTAMEISNKTQGESLEVLKSILELMRKRDGKDGSVKAAEAPAPANVVRSAPRQGPAQAVTNAPVSMAKPSY